MLDHSNLGRLTTRLCCRSSDLRTELRLRNRVLPVVRASRFTWAPGETLGWSASRAAARP